MGFAATAWVMGSLEVRSEKADRIIGPIGSAKRRALKPRELAPKRPRRPLPVEPRAPPRRRQLPMAEDLMSKIVSLSKRRGYVFPASEIYGGIGSSWD